MLWTWDVTCHLHVRTPPRKAERHQISKLDQVPKRCQSSKRAGTALPDFKSYPLPASGSLGCPPARLPLLLLLFDFPPLRPQSDENRVAAHSTVIASKRALLHISRDPPALPTSKQNLRTFYTIVTRCPPVRVASLF